MLNWANTSHQGVYDAFMIGRLARFVTRILKEMDTGFLPVESWCQQLSHNIHP